MSLNVSKVEATGDKMSEAIIGYPSHCDSVINGAYAVYYGKCPFTCYNDEVHTVDTMFEYEYIETNNTIITYAYI